MKINDIPLGGRFVLEGQTYVKTGPMMARGEGGETRVVPRYMVLQAADGAVAGTPAAAAPAADRAALGQAWSRFYAECRQLVPPQAQGQLEAARQRFLAASGLEDRQ